VAEFSLAWSGSRSWSGSLAWSSFLTWPGFSREIGFSLAWSVVARGLDFCRMPGSVTWSGFLSWPGFCRAVWFLRVVGFLAWRVRVLSHGGVVNKRNCACAAGTGTCASSANRQVAEFSPRDRVLARVRVSPRSRVSLAWPGFRTWKKSEKSGRKKVIRSAGMRRESEPIGDIFFPGAERRKFFGFLTKNTFKKK
jgi:hypothetical protein